MSSLNKNFDHHAALQNTIFGVIEVLAEDCGQPEGPCAAAEGILDLAYELDDPQRAAPVIKTIIDRLGEKTTGSLKAKALGTLLDLTEKETATIRQDIVQYVEKNAESYVPQNASEAEKAMFGKLAAAKAQLCLPLDAPSWGRPFADPS